MQVQDVEKLAELSRLELSAEEKEGMLRDLEQTLAYISQIQEVDVSAEADHELRNVVRDDGQAHDSSQYRDAIIGEFPESEGGYLKVKQVL